jgi:hypothetical protein
VEQGNGYNFEKAFREPHRGGRNGCLCNHAGNRNRDSRKRRSIRLNSALLIADMSEATPSSAASLNTLGFLEGSAAGKPDFNTNVIGITEFAPSLQ